MKSRSSFRILIVILFFVTLIGFERAYALIESESRIDVYSQYGLKPNKRSDGDPASYLYTQAPFLLTGGSKCGTSSWVANQSWDGKQNCLAQGGCNLFAYAHAIEWLEGAHLGDSILVDLIKQCCSPSNNKGHSYSGCKAHINAGYGNSFKAYNAYADNRGCTFTYFYSEGGVSHDASWVRQMMNNGTVFVVHVTNHYVCAVDYVVCDKDGNIVPDDGEYIPAGGAVYFQIVDSAPSASSKEGRTFSGKIYDLSADKTKLVKHSDRYGYYYGKTYFVKVGTLSVSAGLRNINTWSGHQKTMVQIAPTSIQLSASNDVLFLNRTSLSLTATTYPEEAEKSVKWVSSDPTIATVMNGLVTPISIGDVIIQAVSTIDESIRASCNIQVKYDGTNKIAFEGIIVPYRYKINTSGFSWRNGSGDITSSDLNLKEIIFRLYHPNAATPVVWRYPANANEIIGRKTVSMAEMSDLNCPKFAEICSIGTGFFEIEAIDILGRSLKRGRLVQVDTANGAVTSADAMCKHTQFIMTSNFEDPILKGEASLNGHRYEWYRTTYNWFEAEEYARKVGGHLATISSKEENDIVFSMVHQDSDFGAWLGGYREDGVFKWITGEPFSYENWNDDEPNKLVGEQENWLAMMRTAGKWRDTYYSNYAWKYIVVEYEPQLVEEIMLAGHNSPSVGDTFVLSKTILPENAYNNSIVFSSTNNAVATVDQEGLVTILSEGDASIIATAQDGSGTQGVFDLYIMHTPVNVESVTIETDRALYTGEDTITLVEGQVFELNVFVSPSSADNQDYRINSTDYDVAVVEDESNHILAVGSGTCRLFVVAADGEIHSNSINVIVVPNSGQCGDNLTWCKTGTELTISGTGAMYDYDNNGGPWGQEISSLKLEEGITSIGANAFYYSQVNTIEWPNTLKTIGRLAFHGCKQLETLNNLPEGLETLGTDAFSGCSNLSSVILPSSLKTIGGDAFQFTSLETISIPASVRTISSNPFCCTTIQSIQVEKSDYFKVVDGVLYTKDGKTLIAYPCEDERDTYTVRAGTEKIQNNAFYGQKYLTSLVFPWGLKTINGYACYGINTLQSVTIPGSVTTIGNNALVSCPNLTISCTNGSAAREYASANSIPYILIDSPIVNPDFVLPIGTKIIEEDAFMGISAKSIKLPEGITEIRANAFANCPNLKQIYIPEGCERIATTAFSGVSDLVIYGMTESYAEFYAERRGFEFEDVK